MAVPNSGTAGGEYVAKVIDAILRLKDQFSPVMHQVSKSASEHTQIQKRLGKSLEDTKQKFQAMSTGAMVGGAALAAAIGGAIKANAELGGTIAKLNAAGAMSGQSMEGMRAKIEQVAKASHSAQNEVAGLFLTAKQAGMSTVQIEGTVAAAINFSKVSGMDRAEAVKSLSQVTRAWTLTEQDQVSAMDQVAAVASRSGQDLGALQTTLAGMSEHAAHAGVSLADLSTTLGYMQGNMHMTSEQASGALNGMFSVIEGGSPKAAKALAAIGMSTQQLAENVKEHGLAAAMADVAQKVDAQGGDVAGTLKKITGSTEAAKLAMQLMSVDGMSNFQDLAGAVQQSAGTVKKGLGELGKSPAVQLKNAKQDLMTEFQAMVADIMPIVTTTTRITGDLLKAFLALPAPIKDTIEAAGGIVLAGTAISMVVGTVGKSVIDGTQTILKGTDKAGKAFESMTGKISGHSGTIRAAITRIGTSATSALSMLKPSNAINGIKSLASSISGMAGKVTALPGVIRGAVGRVVGVFTSMPGQIMSVVSKVRAVFSGGLVNAIRGGMMAIRAIMAANPIGLALLALSIVIMIVITHWSQFKTAIIAAMAAVAAFMGPIIEHLKQTFTGLWTKVQAVFSQILAAWNRLSGSSQTNSSVISAILTVLGAVFGAVFASVATSVEVAIDVIAGVISTLLSVLGDIIDFIVNVFTGNWSAAWESVKKIFTDIIDGIKNIFTNVIDDISGALDRIIGKSGDAKSAAQDAEAAGGGGGGGDDGGDTPHNAAGTKSWRGGLTFINEQGGELVDLPRGSRVYPHDKSLQMEYARGKREAAAASGGSITIAKLADSIVVHDQQDIDGIVNALVYKLKSYGINSMAGAI